jgi:EpsI family protein
LRNPLESLETSLAGWKAQKESKMADEVIAVLKPSSYLMRTYKRDSRTLELLIVFFSEQKEGAAAHSPKNCLQGTGWEISDTAKIEVDPGISVNRVRLRNSDTHLSGLYWYQSQRGIFANEYVGKLLLLRDALFEMDTSETLVWITLADSPEALAEGLNFVRPVMRRLRPLLQCSKATMRSN